MAIRSRRAKLQREVTELDPELGLKLTKHACDRAWEMGVPAEALVNLVRHGSSVPLRSEISGLTGQVFSLPELDWCPVLSHRDLGVVVTILFKTDQRYERDGRAYKPA